MCDRASVNDVAMRTIGVLYTHMIEIGYTLDYVGERMKTPILDEFTKAWTEDKTRMENPDSAIIFCHPMVE